MNVRATSGVNYKNMPRVTTKKYSEQKKVPAGDRIRLGQFLICLLLFMSVFVGKGMFPQRLERVCSTLQTLLTFDVDFHAALSELGASFESDGGIVVPIGRFYAEVFGPTEEDAAQSSSAALPVFQSFMEEEQIYLYSTSKDTSAVEHYFHREGSGRWFSKLCGEERRSDEAPASVAAVGAVLLEVAYEGQPLPENYTLNMLSLGELETATPVIGTINSGFGYRDHPINGKYLFHGGVDIGGQIGDPIRAFAAGTVEYIGEDRSYGLYLQLDHGNGVKSFYAHCDSVCVKKGQNVELGETIGEVGESGAATGPHLHLEIKCQAYHLNPAHYIECVNSI